MISFNPSIFAPADQDGKGFSLLHIPSDTILDFAPEFWDMPDRVWSILLEYTIGIHWSQLI